MLILLLYTLSLLLLLLITVISAILTLCLRDRAKRVACDVTLVVGTLVIVLGLSGSLLPKEALEAIKRQIKANGWSSKTD